MRPKSAQRDGDVHPTFGRELGTTEYREVLHEWFEWGLEHR